MKVSIHYPSGDIETIAARATEVADEMELRAHSFLTPLGPGDVVRIDAEGEVLDVVHLEPQFIWEVALHLPADFLAGPLPEHHPARVIVEGLAETWGRDASVTQMTLFNLVISSQSERWFKDTVAGSKYVEHIAVTRTPKVREVNHK